MMNEFIFPKNLSIDLLVEEIRSYASTKDLDLLYLAYEFADNAHKGQTRMSGEPYIKHPLSTAYLLSKMKIDINIIVVALLHDVPEDTEVTLEEIEKEFGADIANMLRGITKLGKLKYRGVERYIENLRKMFVAMAEDVRVMIIKFADRIHNLSTLEYQPPNKRYRIALESLEIYSAIANRLGMGEFKNMLESLSFPYVFPKEYQKVKIIRDDYLADAGSHLDDLQDKVKKYLNTVGVNIIDVHGRQKQLYSLYLKLIQKEWDITRVYDVLAIRIVVESVGDCYAVLGLLHEHWSPLKGRIKDYIAQPKPNGYQSLHTTVFSDSGMIAEFQIRTKKMHDEAEYGIASHWHYDEKGARLPAKDVSWAKELAKIQKEFLNNIKDLEELKLDIFKNRIFVFTPQGDVIDLPEDATPIDFAYHIHTEVGNKCNGAKVNDQLVSLDTPLKSGDVVDIITDRNRKGPNPSWMKMAKTRVAKTHIKNALNKSGPLWIKNIFSGSVKNKKIKKDKKK